MKRFRDDTEGYDTGELAELNHAWDQITSHGAYAQEDNHDDIVAQSMLDYWAQMLLAAYDAGKRGDALTEWFYAP